MKKAILIVLIIIFLAGFYPMSKSRYNYIKTSVALKIKERKGPLKEYAVSIIDIDRPIVVEIQGLNYIIPDSALKAYNGNDSIFIGRKDVLRYNDQSTEQYAIDYSVYNQNAINLKNKSVLMEAYKTIGKMTVYKFKLPPNSFRLSLQQKRINKTQTGNVSEEYSNEYDPVVEAVYSQKRLRGIDKLSKQKGL